ncbi:glycosyltransferase family 4 protein [Planctomicrobium piriforme]|uniref:Glycosyltransferase involved in cell wall bisynthesis n=1 Tax=Planctomicrobium piriforme TaxID=1576369 RepID=A0A1I3FGM3_9PLAN|nr:glycosyltransferase family 4 protein [Planctomicrobium piriforme]SFI10061.1 Glycosyltransferase involved in cell wall bisynthesis [Planctomicrobium piriforme]
MKIAQVSPLHESVPPRCYGGTERIVSYLTEALVEMGHDVTLFASGDSKTSADLCSVVPQSLRLDEKRKDPVIYHMLQLAEVARAAHKFDIIHFHTDFLHFPLFRHIDTPQLTTLHGRLDLDDLMPIYDEFSDMPVVSISDSQRKPLPQANWFATVYNGVPEETYDFQAQPGKYFAFVGRVSPEKGTHRAIEIALRLGIPLKIAAKIDPVDREYFETEIKHHLDNPLIEYLGEVNESQKNVLLGGALAALFPIDWPEPFGLVMIEAMACGTPVIAFRHGSVPEVMVDGVTGFVVDTVDEAVAACQRLGEIDRRACRNHFEAKFSSARMAEGYLAAYRKLISTVNVAVPSSGNRRELQPTRPFSDQTAI